MEDPPAAPLSRTAGRRPAPQETRVESKVMVQPEALGRQGGRLIEGPYLSQSPSRLVQFLADDGSELSHPLEIAAEDLRSMYEWMLRARVFDTRMISLQRQGRIAFFVSAMGEEAALIGTASALRPEDWVFPA